MYRVSIIKDLPEYDALPVAKVTVYPLEKRDYRPFAQNVLCFGEDLLFLRMWAFETSPAPGSEMRCVIYPFPDKPEVALHIWLSAPHDDGFASPSYGAYISGAEVKADIPVSDVRPHSGEDLQGVFWGASVTVNLATLKSIAGDIPVRPGYSFPGNFYKTCPASDMEHYGCFYPADFNGNPYSPDSMDIFELIGY